MKIGYPCINLSIEEKCNRTFRLLSFSEDKLVETIKSNLIGLRKILEFNVKNNIFFFRISSQLIPFASHPVNQFNWQNYFKDTFIDLGIFIKSNNIRISMHPDQFVLINSTKKEIVNSSIRELLYHCEVLDLMEIDNSHKVQIHVGGVYSDKDAAMNRFVSEYNLLPQEIKNRLVIENDDRLYNVDESLRLYSKTNIPILFDNFHHSLNNKGETILHAARSCFLTWTQEIDGTPMVDYSSQDFNGRKGKHSETINVDDFQSFINEIKGLDCDIMLEIKDKEKSALKLIKTFQLY